MELQKYEGDMVAIDDHVQTRSGLRRHNLVKNISFRPHVHFISMFIATKVCSYGHKYVEIHL